MVAPTVVAGVVVLVVLVLVEVEATVVLVVVVLEEVVELGVVEDVEEVDEVEVGGGRVGPAELPATSASTTCIWSPYTAMTPSTATPVVATKAETSRAYSTAVTPRSRHRRSTRSASTAQGAQLEPKSRAE